MRKKDLFIAVPPIPPLHHSPPTAAACRITCPRTLILPCDILVIEPEPDIRIIIQTSFEMTTPWQVHLTGSYEEGLALIPHLLPKALLINLPFSLSIEDTILKPFQAMADRYGIFLAVMLDRARASDCQELMDLGIYGIIPKPFDCQQVTALLLDQLN